MSFLKNALAQYLVKNGFTPGNGETPDNAEVFFKDGKQINIIGYWPKGDDSETRINVYTVSKDFCGEFKPLEVLNEKLPLLKYFITH